ncbi:MAG: hypothetical protein M3Y21_06425 [Candidatus Eremiobacteraeota bacterium]|nr:hypothetical protein [Candidatus Eremiobacteraeota bacterium]
MNQIDKPLPSIGFDYAIGIVALWLVGSLYVDAWAHGHVAVESFFTPFHAAFYSGILAALVVVGVLVTRNHRAGYPWRHAFPKAYRFTVLGVILFVFAGFGDMLWHLLLGVENGIDALLSPTHQALGFAILLIASGPVCAALERGRARVSFAQQLPLLLCLATWLGLIHFGTAYAIDPAASRANAPLLIANGSHDVLTILAVTYYKLGYGVLVIIFWSLLIAGFGRFAAIRFPLAPGALTVLFVLGNSMLAAPYTNDTPLLLITVISSFVCGVVGDLLVAYADPHSGPGAAMRFTIILPVAYFSTYFIATWIAGGIWWDWNVVLASTGWAAATGFGLSLFVGQLREAQS